ncbi:MAG: tetratricopeptide repeat protein, partial [Lentisphaeria bacterium]
ENATGLLQQLLVDGYENRFDVYRLLGQVYLQDRKFIMAERSFFKALEIKDDLACNKGLLQCYLEFANYHKAGQLCGQLLSKNVSDLQLWQLAINLELAKGNNREALVKILTAEKMSKLTDSLLLQKAQLLFHFSLNGQAAEAYSKIKDRKVLSVDELVKFCESQLQLGNIAIAKELINSVEKTLDVKLILARIAIAENSIDLGKTLLEEILVNDGLNEKAIFIYVPILREEENYDRASNLLRRLGENSHAYIALAQIAVAQNKLDQAEDFLQKALSLKYNQEVDGYLKRVKAARKQIN